MRPLAVPRSPSRLRWAVPRSRPVAPSSAGHPAADLLRSGSPPGAAATGGRGRQSHAYAQRCRKRGIEAGSAELSGGEPTGAVIQLAQPWSELTAPIVERSRVAEYPP
jgi:hypothetical protein